MLKAHRFIPRIPKRATIKRKEVSGYPNLLKNRVAKTIVPRKKIICFVDPGISTAAFPFFNASLFWKKSFRRRMTDKIIRSIPRQRGNSPVPDLRKVPRGIFKERRVVIAPKRKITIPTTASSFFNLHPMFPN